MGRSKRAFLSLGIVAAVGCSSTPPPQDPVLTADPPVGGAEGLSSGTANTEVQRAIQYVKNGSYAEAKEHAEKALAEKPDHPEATFLMGVAVEHLGDKKAAEDWYKKTLKIDPGMVDASLNLGALYLDPPPRPDDAIAVLKAAAEKAPAAFDIQSNLAYAYSLKNDFANASKAYDAALAVKEDVDTRYAYGALLIDAKELPRAAEQLKKALDGTKDAALAAKLGHLLGEAQAWSDCVRAFDLALSAKKEPDLLVRRGACKHGTKEEESARADYEEAIKLDPKFATAYYYLGMSYSEEKKNRANALLTLDKAAKVGANTEIGKRAKAEYDKLARQKP
ncbi:MAG: tetratricopeptide repeat protein [Polyangiaceae bacterium]